MATIFSKIIAGEIPSYKVAEDDRYYAFLDIHPIARGHTLVVPRREVDYIFDLEDADLEGLIRFSKKIARHIKAGIPCKRVGVAVMGLDVPHAHVHLVPINEGGDLDFGREKLELSAAEFEAIRDKIKC